MIDLTKSISLITVNDRGNIKNIRISLVHATIYLLFDRYSGGVMRSINRILDRHRMSEMLPRHIVSAIRPFYNLRRF